MSLGMRTLLTAEYDSATSFDGETPVTGRGSVMTTVRRAMAGMELSTEFSVVRFESFSMSGARIVLGIFVTRGARLYNQSLAHSSSILKPAFAHHLIARFCTSPFWSSRVFIMPSTARAAVL